MSTKMRRCWLTMVLLSLVASGCADERSPDDGWKLPNIVRVEANADWGAFLSFPTFFVLPATKDQPWGVLLNEGDLLSGEGEGMVPYRAGDGAVLRLSDEGWNIRLEGKIVWLDLDDSTAHAWLASATNAELETLRMVRIAEDPDSATLATIKHLGSVNPAVHLDIKSPTALLAVLPHFQTEALWLNDMTVGSQLSAIRLALSGQAQLHTLLIALPDSLGSEIVPSLPALRHLLTTAEDSVSLSSLWARLPGLTSLTILDFSVSEANLNFLRGAPTGINNLAVHGGQVKDVGGLQYLPNLQSLILGVGDSTDFTAVQNLKELRLFGLWSELDQQRFNAMVTGLPDLRALLVMSDSTLDVTPLASLKSLEAVALLGEFRNLEKLQEITTLRYVAVPQSDSGSTDQLVALRAAHPDALVVAVKPFCLGSGWILVLVPTVALLLQLRRRRIV